MSDFILPGDIEQMALQLSQDVADARAMLDRICIFKWVPLEMAEAQVQRYENRGFSTIEAIRKVYNEIAYS